ncbi:MAG TPA: hypothetical protein VGB96_12300 [Archangium sp.]
MNHEADRDPELAALLRSALPEPPADAVDWGRLRGAVARGAELPLARRRRAPARRWLPLGAAGLVAASLALALRPSGDPRPLPAEERVIVETIVAESLPSNVDQLISGDAAEGALLAAVVGS